MAETIYVRGEGGAVIAMDLPLPEAIAERYERGQLQRVNSDGSPYAPTQAPPEPDPGTGGDQDADGGDGADEQDAPPAPEAGRPPINAPKATWIAHVVRRGLLSADDAANYSKADLIDMTG